MKQNEPGAPDLSEWPHVKSEQYVWRCPCLVTYFVDPMQGAKLWCGRCERTHLIAGAPEGDQVLGKPDRYMIDD